MSRKLRASPVEWYIAEMHPGARSLFVAALFVAAASGVAAADSDAAKACITSWGEARFGGVGFKHIVHVADKCAASAVCAVSTDVAPEPQTVTVPGNGAIEVVTYLASPASKFTPRVTCEMKP